MRNVSGGRRSAPGESPLRRPLIDLHPILNLHSLGLPASVQPRCPERAIGLPRIGAAAFGATSNKPQKE